MLLRPMSFRQRGRPDAAAELARGGIASAPALADNCFKAANLGGLMTGLGRKRFVDRRRSGNSIGRRPSVPPG